MSVGTKSLSHHAPIPSIRESATTAAAERATANPHQHSSIPAASATWLQAGRRARASAAPAAMEPPSYAAMAAPITDGPPKAAACTQTNHSVLTHQVPTRTQPHRAKASRTTGSPTVQANAARGPGSGRAGPSGSLARRERTAQVAAAEAR